MSSSGSFALKDSAISSGQHRKPRRKRHRNKFRNSSLRKKKTKRFCSVKKTGTFKSNTPKINLDSEKIMSNWYWSNYKKAVDWQDRHKIAHWKACALALQEENRYLLQIIKDMQLGMVPEMSVTQSNLGEHSNFNRNARCFRNFNFPQYGTSNDEYTNEGVDNTNNDIEDIGDDDGDGDEMEFEMSEEMMQFFEQSYRHKMDMKKLKEKELLNKAEEEIKQIQMNKIKRSTEMNLLYGDGASMIVGMETAVQLSFDRYCDTKSPKYWPNIPFRLCIVCKPFFNLKVSKQLKVCLSGSPAVLSGLVELSQPINQQVLDMSMPPSSFTTFKMSNTFLEKPYYSLTRQQCLVLSE